jgi:hypothetical protein
MRTTTVNVYVDGENLFTRAENVLKKALGKDASFGSVVLKDMRHLGLSGWPLGERLRVYPPAKFFWDTRFAGLPGWDYSGNHIVRGIYFTSCVGDEDVLHQARVLVRGHSFDPEVLPEFKDLAERRAHLLMQDGIMERPKGVDVGLAVRILEDAYLGAFDGCYLFTSDADFLPVIRAVKRMGKTVYLAGFREGLSKRSPLEHVPDKFIYLGDVLRRDYVLSDPAPPPC